MARQEPLEQWKQNAIDISHNTADYCNKTIAINAGCGILAMLSPMAVALMDPYKAGALIIATIGFAATTSYKRNRTLKQAFNEVAAEEAPKTQKALEPLSEKINRLQPFGLNYLFNNKAALLAPLLFLPLGPEAVPLIGLPTFAYLKFLGEHTATGNIRTQAQQTERSLKSPFGPKF